MIILLNEKHILKLLNKIKNMLKNSRKFPLTDVLERTLLYVHTNDIDPNTSR